MMNANLHIIGKTEEIHCSDEAVRIGLLHGDKVVIYATNEQLKAIADTINGHLEYLSMQQAQQDQLELHFEHQQVLEVAV